MFFYGCGTNHNGALCTSIEDRIYHDLYNQCYRSFYTNCSSECQTELHQVSDSAGCCIHDNYVSRMPSLWMNCNIEQPEVCADTPNIADILDRSTHS